MAYYSDPGLDINEYKFTRPPTDLQTFQVLHTGESDGDVHYPHTSDTMEFNIIQAITEQRLSRRTATTANAKPNVSA